jgi:hypothetical protein
VYIYKYRESQRTRKTARGWEGGDKEREFEIEIEIER